MNICIPIILSMLISCNYSYNSNNQQNHYDDSLFVKNINDYMLVKYGGNLHSIWHSDTSRSWVSFFENIGNSCDSSLLKGFKYETSLITNYNADTTNSQATYFNIANYKSEIEAKNAYNKYLSLRKKSNTGDENVCSLTIEYYYIEKSFLFENYIIVFATRGYSDSTQNIMRNSLDVFFNR